MKKKLVEQITTRSQNFSKWYSDICLKNELIAYSDTKGFIIYLPDSYFVWEKIKEFLNEQLELKNHQNVYFPLFLNEHLFQKEKKHIQGFTPETLFVTNVGNKVLSEKLIIRPTSEVLFSNYYSKKIVSYRDLPKLYNQWCSVVRWEKNTKPFLRGKEFLWQEGHTAHVNKTEAITEVKNIIKIYKKLGKELLAIPFISGEKTDLEKFPGAINTFCVEALMYDGQSLQSGTSHYLGTKFAEVFDIKFQNIDNQINFVHQTSFGVSTRLLGAIIMVHGDDEGLVWPPYIAPIQIVIIPLQIKNDQLMEEAFKIFNNLKQKYRVHLALEDKTIGWKFSQYEMKGVPVRITIGIKELSNRELTIFTRYNSSKKTYQTENLLNSLDILFHQIHEGMYLKALQHLKKNQYEAHTYSEFKYFLKKGGYVAMSINGEEAEMQIKKDTNATARIILERNLITPNCPVTDKKALYTVLFARSY